MEAQGHLRASFWINANCRYSFELPRLSTPLRNCLVPARPRKVSSRLMAEPKSMMLMLPLQRHIGKHLTLARNSEQKTKKRQAFLGPSNLLAGASPYRAPPYTSEASRYPRKDQVYLQSRGWGAAKCWAQRSITFRHFLGDRVDVKIDEDTFLRIPGTQADLCESHLSHEAYSF